jgi:hypothetical protein
MHMHARMNACTRVRARTHTHIHTHTHANEQLYIRTYPQGIIYSYDVCMYRE